MAEREFLIRNIETDVSHPDCITVLYCEDCGKKIMLYGLSDCELGHYGLLELAQDPDFTNSDKDYVLSEKTEVKGGALIDYQNLAKIRDSHAFGPIKGEILDQFTDRIQERRLRLKAAKRSNK